MKISIISRLWEPRAGSKNNFWVSTYSFFFGSTTSCKTVNEKTAMQTIAVYACVRILAEIIASLPLHTYKYAEVGKEKAMEHSIYHLLADEPNPEMSSFVFRETLMVWGNAYAQIIRDGRGKVLALYPLMPDKMSVKRTENGDIYYIYKKVGEEIPLRSDEVLHIPGLGFDGLIGYSPIAMAKNAIDMAIATDEYDTEAEKPKAQSAKFKGKFYSRNFDGNYRFICDEDDEGVDATIISVWLNAVPEQPVAIP